MPSRPIFIGRSAELAAIDTLVRKGTRLVTLWGPGGAGKTSTALRWTEARRAGGGAVIWAEIAGARTESELLAVLAASLAVPLDHREDMREAIVRSLEARSAVLVADNVEQLDDGARSALGALALRHERGVLVTSRDLLDVEGECAVSVEPLSESDALALYTTLSGAPADDTARAIVRRLDALALAVELAAARAALLGSRELLERLDGKLDLLGGPNEEPRRPSRHASLRSVIAWSWDLLEGSERNALLACATFEAPFDASLAALAMGESDVAAMDALERLRRRALIHVGPHDENGRPRLFLHEAVRDFAREELVRLGQSGDAFDRHARAVVARAEPMARRVRIGDSVDPSLSNRRANLAIAVGRNTASAPEAMLCLAALASVTGPLAPVLHDVDRLADRAEPPLRARLLIAKGEVLRAMGRHAEAEKAANDALFVVTALASNALEDAHAIEADALRLAGMVARSRGDAKGALALLTRARERYRALGERALEGSCVGEIGVAEQSLGRHDAARTLFAEAIAIHVVEGSSRAEGVERSYLAVATHRSGEMRAAIALHEAALRLHRSVGHRRLEGAELLHLGFVHHELGNSGSARSAFAEARNVLALAGARGLEALAMVLEARLDVDEGDNAMARVRLVEAERAAPPGWLRLSATRLVVNGHLVLSSDPGAAATFYAAALEASRDVEVGFEALTPAYLGLALARTGAVRSTLKPHFDASRKLLARASNPHVLEAFAILSGDATKASDVALASSSEVRRALHFVGVRGALVIEDEARVVVLPDGRSIDLSRRRNVRLILLACARARRDGPGTPLTSEALVAAGWPDERLSATAATKRLHTAIWTLRSLGLGDVLISSDGGYFLDPHVRVDLR